MAIFYRMNSLSRVMEDALRRANVPYQIARGVEFYNRKEIKDVLAYLRVVANPSDEISLNRIVNVPPRGVGDAALKQIAAHASALGLTLWQAMEQAGSIAALSSRAAGGARQFVELIRRWRRAAGMQPAEGNLPGQASLATATPATGRGRIRALMEDVVQRSGMEQLLKKTGGEELEELANVNELISSAAEYDKENSDGSLDEYLGIISLVSDADHLKGAGGAVTLMTLHAAKGLEFPVVAIIGLEDGILPHSRARANMEEMEEERRLFFVGITRAEERLLISKANTRTIRGLRERTITSPFLNELPEEELAIYDHTGSGGNGSYETERFRDRSADVATETTFRKGQRVKHPSFGIGRVADISVMGQQTRAIIEFDRAGRKTLILEYARLEPA
jgi:DNA helicase-2/ATP-dependent DNA helicase PcrA